MRALLIFILVLAPLRAEMIDKLAITVNHSVITELTIDEDLRVAALINGLPVNRNLDTRRAASDRLVQRLLIQHEMEVSRYPLPTQPEINIYFDQVQNSLGGAAAFPGLLRSYDLNQNILLDYLTAQLTMLRFINYRFSPDVSVSDSDVESAYQREAQHSAPLDEARRAALAQKLIDERTDAALDAWLAETRKQVNIVYLDTSLQ